MYEELRTADLEFRAFFAFRLGVGGEFAARNLGTGTWLIRWKFLPPLPLSSASTG